MQSSSRQLASMIHASSSSVAASPSTSNTVPKGLDPAYHNQLADLVHRNYESQSAIQTLRSKLSTESTHFQELLGALRTQHQQEVVQFESTLARFYKCVKIAMAEEQLKTMTERERVLKELEENRKEQLHTLRRDFRILTWQMKETEMEAKVEELEEEKERVERSAQVEVTSWQQMVDEAQAMIHAKQTQLSQLEEERDALNTKVERLKLKQEAAVAESKSYVDKLERAMLQLDGEKTRYDDMQKKYDELRLTNNDLKRQLDKWQNLETKGNTEIEVLRKQRIELEVSLNELQERYDKHEVEYQKRSEKVLKKNESLTELVREWEGAYQQLEADSKDSRAQVEKLQRRIAKLKTSLEEERLRVRPPSPQKARTGETHARDEDEDMEVGDSPVVKPSQPARKRPTVKRMPPPAPPDADSEIEEINQPAERQQKRKGKEKSAVSESEDAKPKKGRPRSKSKATQPFEKESDSDVEEVHAEEMVKKSGDKVLPKSQKPREAAKPQESEGPAPTRSTKAASKGKRKQATEESDVEMEDGPPPAKRRANSKAPSDTREKDAPSIAQVKGTTGRSASAIPSGSIAIERRKLAGERRAASVQRLGDVAEEGEEEGGVKKKKMRKINIFGGAEPTSFNFGSQATDNLGLNIPTELSPVKESDAIPNRLGATGTSSVLGGLGIGNILRFPSLSRRT